MDETAYEQISKVDPSGSRHIILSSSTVSILLDKWSGRADVRQKLLEHVLEQLRK